MFEPFETGQHARGSSEPCSILIYIIIRRCVKQWLVFAVVVEKRGGKSLACVRRFAPQEKSCQKVTKNIRRPLKPSRSERSGVWMEKVRVRNEKAVIQLSLSRCEPSKFSFSRNFYNQSIFRERARVCSCFMQNQFRANNSLAVRPPSCRESSFGSTWKFVLYPSTRPFILGPCDQLINLRLMCNRVHRPGDRLKINGPNPLSL